MLVQVPWRQFLVNLCAVVGGCFAKLASTSPQNWHFGTPKLKQVLLKRNWLLNLDIFSDCLLSHIFCHRKLCLEMSWVGGVKIQFIALGGQVLESTEKKQIWSYLPSLNLTVRPWKQAFPPKETIVFQSSIFRYELLVSGRGYAVRFYRKRWESFESLDWSLPRMSNMLLKIVDAIME